MSSSLITSPCAHAGEELREAMETLRAEYARMGDRLEAEQTTVMSLR